MLSVKNPTNRVPQIFAIKTSKPQLSNIEVAFSCFGAAVLNERVPTFAVSRFFFYFRSTDQGPS